MPFGAVFGALFFVVLGLWLVVTPHEPTWAHPIAGRAFLVATALTLSAGLLYRQRWARWGGVAFAGGLATAVTLLGPLGTGTAAFLVLFGSLAVAIALALPGTGRIESPAGEGDRARLRRILGTAAIVGAIGLCASVVWGLAQPPAAPAASAVTPAAGLQRVQWTPYGTGLDRARSEGRPMLVTFVTDWCGYCRKMDKTTWSHPSVIERMNGDLVAVRINAEEAVERAGFKGRDLASRFGVYGYPTLLLLDSDGEVMSRAGGYMSSRELLSWIEASLGAASAAADDAS